MLIKLLVCLLPLLLVTVTALFFRKNKYDVSDRLKITEMTSFFD